MRIGPPRFDRVALFFFPLKSRMHRLFKLLRIRTMSGANLVNSTLYLVSDLRNRRNLWMSTALQKLFFVFAAADPSFGA